jgi:hypothetical protein
VGQTSRDQASVADCSPNGSASQYRGQQIGSVRELNEALGASRGLFFLFSAPALLARTKPVTDVFTEYASLRIRKRSLNENA